MRSSAALRVLSVTAILLTYGLELRAQGITAPHPSLLWAAPSSRAAAGSGRALGAGPSPKERGFLLGALIGGVVTGFLGNRICRAYSATTPDACLGDTLWWAAGGAMLGGLIGATGSGNQDSLSARRPLPPNPRMQPTGRTGAKLRSGGAFR